jgi:hypothetical protein
LRRYWPPKEVSERAKKVTMAKKQKHQLTFDCHRKSPRATAHSTSATSTNSPSRQPPSSSRSWSQPTCWSGPSTACILLKLRYRGWA